MSVDDRLVAVHQGGSDYPADPPFDPDTPYPEYRSRPTSSRPNHAYAAVRQVLALLGLDHERFGSNEWNPLAELVRPGDTVVVKPNLIQEDLPGCSSDWRSVVTHASVVRAIADYVLLAAGDDVRLVICDGPQADSDFDAICDRGGLRAVVEEYRGRGLAVELVDLRRQRFTVKDDVITERIALPGDPAGYTEVDLGDDSEFRTYSLNGRFYGADYDFDETARFHADGRHRYVLCRTVMDADVVINVPKLKTHKKTGITIALKNLVGVNGYRNCLPHHTLGTPAEGGDEFATSTAGPKMQSAGLSAFKRALAAGGGRGGTFARLAKRAGKILFGDTGRVIRSGNWYGNDTAWRMVLDLNKAFFNFDGEGRPRSEPRRYLAIVDGIIAGEGQGPLAPDPKPCGLVVAGLQPLAVDTVCAALMGFDVARLPLLDRGWGSERMPVAGFRSAEVRCRSDHPGWSGDVASLASVADFGFRPHFGWVGHAERTPRRGAD